MKICARCNWHLDQKETIYNYCMMKQPYVEFPWKENNCTYFSPNKLNKMFCNNCRIHIDDEDCRCLENKIEHSYCCKNLNNDYIGCCEHNKPIK